eukprot:9488759-Pyramimonas_sp.AAC.1
MGLLRALEVMQDVLVSWLPRALGCPLSWGAILFYGLEGPWLCTSVALPTAASSSLRCIFGAPRGWGRSTGAP